MHNRNTRSKIITEKLSDQNGNEELCIKTEFTGLQIDLRGLSFIKAKLKWILFKRKLQLLQAQQLSSWALMLLTSF